MGWFKKVPSTSFVSVTSLNSKISCQHVWSLVLTLFSHCFNISILLPSTRPILIKISFSTQVHVEVKLSVRVTKFCSHYHIYNIISFRWLHLLGDVRDRNDDIKTIFSKQSYFKEARNSQFWWHQQDGWWLNLVD